MGRDPVVNTHVPSVNIYSFVQMSKLADKDANKNTEEKEEEEMDGLLDPKTPEGGDWERR